MRWMEIKTAQHFSICKRACTQFACFRFLASSPPVARAFVMCVVCKFCFSLVCFFSSYFGIRLRCNVSLYLVCLFCHFAWVAASERARKQNARHNNDVGCALLFFFSLHFRVCVCVYNFVSHFYRLVCYNTYNVICFSFCRIDQAMTRWIFFCFVFFFYTLASLAMAANGFSLNLQWQYRFMSNRIRKGSQ